MEPLFAIGVWALSLVGIAAVVFAARKAAAALDLARRRAQRVAAP